MKASSKLIAYIKQAEGCKLFAYRDSVGIPTIGYGHTKNVKMGQAITLAQAEKFLLTDLSSVETFVTNLNVCKTQGQFDALVDFCYNLGTGSLMTSTLLRKIKAGVNSPTLLTDYKALFPKDKVPTGKTKEQMFDAVVQGQFARWNKAGGKVLPGLVKRRAWEANRWAE